MVYLYNRICYSTTNEETAAIYNINESHIHNVKQKKHIIKDRIIMIPFI